MFVAAATAIICLISHCGFFFQIPFVISVNFFFSLWSCLLNISYHAKRIVKTMRTCKSKSTRCMVEDVWGKSLNIKIFTEKYKRKTYYRGNVCFVSKLNPRGYIPGIKWNRYRLKKLNIYLLRELIFFSFSTAYSY